MTPTNSKTIVVTGGAGYIGCRLVPALVEAGYKVRVFDIMFYGDAGLDAVRDRIEIIEGDIRNVGPDVLQGAYAVINLAGLSAEPAAEYCPDANHSINARAAVQVASLAKQVGVSRFVQASSGSIYDVGAGHGDRDVLHTEDFPVEPFRVYSITKREAEKGILALADGSFTPIVLRKGSVYGYSPRMRMDLVVNTFTWQAMKNGALVLHNGGEMWRPLLDINDAVAGYALMLHAAAEKVSGQIFNLVSNNTRISEVALRVKYAVEQLGISCDLKPDYEFRNLRSCQASNRKMRDVLGFSPKGNIEQAVRDLVAAIRSGTLDPEKTEFYNMRWLDLLESVKSTAAVTGSVLDADVRQLETLRAAVGEKALVAGNTQ